MSVSGAVQVKCLGPNAYSGTSRSTKGSIVKKNYMRHVAFLLLTMAGVIVAVATWTVTGVVIGGLMAACGALGMLALQREERKADE